MQIQNWPRQLGYWLLQLFYRSVMAALGAYVAGAITWWHLGQAGNAFTAGHVYLWLHWSFGAILGMVTFTWCLLAPFREAWLTQTLKLLKSENFWYWAITGTIFYLALGWAVTSWPPGSWVSLLGWIAAVIACLAMICLWIIGIVIMAVNHHEREFNCWLESDERGTEM